MAQLALSPLAGKAPTLVLRCPVCKASLAPIDLTDSAMQSECSRCHFVVANQGGIWRALDPVREIHFRRFVAEYLVICDEEIRSAQAGPGPDLCCSDLNGWRRRIRARSLGYLESKLLPQLEARSGRPLRVLDVGAGTAWLSLQLAWRGHQCVAIDLLDHPVHGLGAARQYRLPSPLACVQAEMDNLPFAGGQFDVAIYSASIHYSEDYLRTLRECLRCLRPGGEVIILDTPFYGHDESGRAMVLEQREALRQFYGLRADRIRSREYLTADILETLERECGLHWRVGRPWYGLNWALRPWEAMLKGQREPSQFYVLSAAAAG